MLSAYLTPARPPVSGALIADRLGIKSGTLRVAVSRLRKRYGKLLLSLLATDGDSSPKQEADYLPGLFRR